MWRRQAKSREASVELQILSAWKQGELETLQQLIDDTEAFDPNSEVQQRKHYFDLVDEYHKYSATEGWTPLHYACVCDNVEIVKLLLSRIERSVKDHKGKSPLHFACEHGHLEVVKILLANSIFNVNEQDSTGKTPLHLACEKDRVKVVKYVMKNCKANINIDARDNLGQTTLDIAKQHKHSKMVLQLISNAKFSDYTMDDLLRWACQGKYHKVLQYLLSESDIKFTQSTINDVLQLACQDGHFKVAKILLTQSKPDVNAKDTSGKTSLHHTCERGFLEVVALLLAIGKPDVDIRDAKGRTALQFAMENDRVDVVLCFLENVNLSVDTKSSVLLWACQCGLVKVSMFLLTKSKVDVNVYDRNGLTALHYASLKGSLIIVKHLVNSCNADINATDRRGRIPQDYAYHYEKYEVASFLSEECNRRRIGANLSSQPQSLAAPSDSPGELNVRYKLPTTVELSWTPVPMEKRNGVITGYVVGVVGPDSSWEIQADTTSVEIPGLRPFSTYNFNVSAMTIAGNGPAANISFTSPEGAPSGSPGGLAVRQKLPMRVELTWSPIPVDKQNGVVTRYIVEVVGPDSSRDILVFDANTTDVVIPGLRPFSTYTFNVSAMTKAGTGPAASISSTTLEAAPSGSPGGLNLRQKLPTTVELSWSPVPVKKQNGVITGYIVKVVGLNTALEIPVNGHSTTSIEIPGLRPFTQYTFNISAMTKVGTGPAATISTTTNKESDILPLLKVPKEGYTCITHNPTCLVYFHQEESENLTIETITDATIYPKLASNEILITPIVRIIPDKPSLFLNKPAIIELVKTIELSDKEAHNEIIPFCTNSEFSEWKELGSECNCRELNDRISFKVTHFSLYAVVSRKPYPKSTVKVKPSTDNPVPEIQSTTTELAIPELPGFKVQIPPSSVNTDRETDITATVLYDCPAVCNENDKNHLASSCIELEPHGITFSKEVRVSIPVPNYAEVMMKNPDAQLQILWHSNICTDKRKNEPIKHYVCQDEEGRYVAIVQINHFSILKPIWLKRVASHVKNLFKHSFSIKARCQVFMSQEMRFQSQLMFSIAVLFYPYRKEPHPIPHNHKHMLADSMVHLKVSNKDTIQFEIKLNKHISSNECKPITGLFAISGGPPKSFTVELDGSIDLPAGLPMGELSIGVQEGSEENQCTLTLIKPRAYLFEESIIKLKAAAERLDRDTAQYEDCPGPLVEAAKQIASMWKKMGELIMKEGIQKESIFKTDIVDLANRINKESQEVVRIAKTTAKACTDKTLKHDIGGVVTKVETISHQLRYLARQEATKQRDEASNFEACQILTDNAENLTMAISKALYCTKSAGIRVPKQQIEQGTEHAHEKVNKPTLDELMILKFTENGEMKKVRIIGGASHVWKNIASLISDDPNKVSTLELEHRGRPCDCLRQTLIDDFINKEPRKYSQDWSGLIELLDDVGLQALAESVKHALHKL